jgi:predicted PurR-regulated permease PerM
MSMTPANPGAQPVLDVPASLDPTVAIDPTPRLRAPTPRAALVILTVILLAVIFYMARGTLGPFILGLILIYIMDPAVDRLARLRIGRFRVPRALAVLLIYVVTIAVLIQAMSSLLGPLVRQVGEFVGDAPAFLMALQEWYRTADLPAFLRSAVDGLLTSTGEATEGLDPGTLLPLAQGVAGFLGSLFGFLIIPVWAFFLLKDRPGLTASINQAIPATWRRDVWASAGIVNRIFGRWLRAQVLLGLVVGLATFVGLEILAFTVDPRFGDFAILLAVLAGLAEFLPIVGPILSMIPTLLIALTVRDPVQGIVAVVALYLIVQQIENNILVPIVHSDAVALHPSAVILALIVGGSIAGLLGAIFALPLAAAGRDLYRYFFRRLSEHDPTVPPPDDPDLLPFRDRLPDAQGNLSASAPPPPVTTDAPVHEPPTSELARTDVTDPSGHEAREASGAREARSRDASSDGPATR